MSDKPSSAKDEDGIRSLVENWARAVRNKDVEQILAHHAADILMFDVPVPLQLKGIEAYKQSWNSFFDWLDRGGTFDLSELSITAGTDIAFCHAIIHCGNPRGSGQEDDLTVRLTIGLKKINGEWMILHEHHSAPAE